MAQPAAYVSVKGGGDAFADPALGALKPGTLRRGVRCGGRHLHVRPTAPVAGRRSPVDVSVDRAVAAIEGPAAAERLIRD